MFKKIISALVVLIFSASLTLAGGVTNIKEVVNRSSKTVRLTTYENKNDVESRWKTTRRIAAGATWRGDMWVPWADNDEQFQNHFLKIEIFTPRPGPNLSDVRVFTLYQSGEDVRTCPDNFLTLQNTEEIHIEHPAVPYNPRAPRVAGEARSGGDRRVVFFDNRDRSVGYRFEELGR